MTETRIIFAHPEMEEFAREICTNTFAEIQRDMFPNEMPNIHIGCMKEIQNAPFGATIVYFSQYSNMLEKKIEEMIIFVLADTPNVKKLYIVDMYDPLATMERVSKEGTIATSNVDAHFWKTLPTLYSGHKTVRILFDHHTLQNRFYFTNGTTSVLFRSAMPLFAKIVGDNPIVFPDDGANKRFASFFITSPKVICGKQRIKDDRVVTIIDGVEDVPNAHVYIVDDLVRSGNTLLACADALFAAGASKVSIVVVHAEFPQDSWKKFIGSKIDTFYVTNTIPRVSSILKNKQPFKVVSVATIVEDLLK